jgi:hypothetical protein
MHSKSAAAARGRWLSAKIWNTHRLKKCDTRQVARPVHSAREAIDPARNIPHAKIHRKRIGEMAAVAVD